MQLLRSVVAKNYRSLGKHQTRVFSSSPINNDGKSTMERDTRLAMPYGILAALGGSLGAYGWYLHADRVVLQEKNESELGQLTKQQEELDKRLEELDNRLEKLDKWQEEVIKQQEEVTKQLEEVTKQLEELDKGQEELIKQLIKKRGF